MRAQVPEVFDCVEGKSAVVQQPSSAELRARALQAVVACPTGMSCYVQICKQHGSTGSCACNQEIVD